MHQHPLFAAENVPMEKKKEIEIKKGGKNSQIIIYAKWMTYFLREDISLSRKFYLNDFNSINILIRAIQRINVPSRWLGGWCHLYFFSFFLSFFRAHCDAKHATYSRWQSFYEHFNQNKRFILFNCCHRHN